VAIHPRYHLLEICAGSGMLGVALKIALGEALRTVAYIERDARAAATLVVRMDDETLDRAPIWDDLQSADGSEFITFVQQFSPLIVAGGIPCQPHSQAGKRRGADDSRDLWSATRRFVRALRPALVFIENVPGILASGGALDILRDLEALGYRVAAPCLMSAEDVGASHRRERVFILAELANADTCGFATQRRQVNPAPDRRRQSQPRGKRACMADAKRARLEVRPGESIDARTQRPPAERGCLDLDIFAPGPDDPDWPAILDVRPDLAPALPQSELRRMAYGVADRVDRLRLAGNGVVPLAAAYAFCALLDTLGGRSAGQ